MSRTIRTIIIIGALLPTGCFDDPPINRADEDAATEDSSVSADTAVANDSDEPSDSIDTHADSAEPDTSVVSSCSGPADCADLFTTCETASCDGGKCVTALRPNTCLIDGQCYAAGDVATANGCQICESGTQWSVNDGGSCDDGDDVCTLGDICVGFMCEPGDAPDDSVGDWASPVIEASVPGTKTRAVAAVDMGAGHWAIAAISEGGSSALPTEPATPLFSGNGAAVVHRAPDGQIIPIITVSGSGSVSLKGLSGATGMNSVIEAWGTIWGPGELVASTTTQAVGNHVRGFVARANPFDDSDAQILQLDYVPEDVATLWLGYPSVVSAELDRNTTVGDKTIVAVDETTDAFLAAYTFSNLEWALIFRSSSELRAPEIERLSSASLVFGISFVDDIAIETDAGVTVEYSANGLAILLGEANKQGFVIRHRLIEVTPPTSVPDASIAPFRLNAGFDGGFILNTLGTSCVWSESPRCVIDESAISGGLATSVTALVVDASWSLSKPVTLTGGIMWDVAARGERLLVSATRPIGHGTDIATVLSVGNYSRTVDPTSDAVSIFASIDLTSGDGWALEHRYSAYGPTFIGIPTYSAAAADDGSLLLFGFFDGPEAILPVPLVGVGALNAFAVLINSADGAACQAD